MKTLIAIPCLSMVHTNFMTAMLNLRKTKDTAYAVSVNSLIYDSRNGFAASAIAGEYSHVLWLDSDMTFQPDLLERLSADADDGLHYVSALCFARKLPTKPVIYKTLTYEPEKGPDEPARAHGETYWDYPRESLFEVAASGFGAVLTSTYMLKRVWDSCGEPFNPMPHMGEDLSFCYRAGQLGFSMYCDSRVKAGHIGNTIFDEQTYLAQTIPPERCEQNQTAHTVTECAGQ